MPRDRKEYMKEYNKQYREKNKEKERKRKKEYNEKNKEKIAKQRKEYNQTPACKKSYRIHNWKRSGVIHHDFDELYEKYINTEYCELCSVKLTEDKRSTYTTRCLDHCHITGEFRNVLCNYCNIRLPKQKN